jgi:hypothetical protein
MNMRSDLALVMQFVLNWSIGELGPPKSASSNGSCVEAVYVRSDSGKCRYVSAYSPICNCTCMYISRVFYRPESNNIQIDAPVATETENNVQDLNILPNGRRNRDW